MNFPFFFLENLIADEFSTELAEGLAFVSGFDDDSRPVLVSLLKSFEIRICVFSYCGLCQCNLLFFM